MSSWKFNEEEEPCFETNDWARMGIPAEDRLVFQGAGFDERSGFEIRLVPNQCSRMMILVAFGSLSRTVHPLTTTGRACKCRRCHNPGSSFTSLQIFIIPPQIHDSTGYHRNQGKSSSARGASKHGRTMFDTVVWTGFWLVSLHFSSHRCSRNAPLCCVFELQLAPHWPV